MKPKLYIVDAFADAPFSGNPAAVCLLEAEPPQGWMQSVAAEMNLSETAFLLPVATDEWRLRWFTPVTEVNLCGHATLAASHVLWHELGEAAGELRFHTRSGLLGASREGGGIGLDFPVDIPRRIPVNEQIIEALGIEPLQAYRGREDLLLRVDRAHALYRLEPDRDLLSQIDARGIIVTAPSDRPEYDFISRFFAPSVGISEDPVTGSAHCVLGPLWGGILGKSQLTGFQASKRGGVVDVVLMDQRVKLIGRAITVLKGEFYG